MANKSIKSAMSSTSISTDELSQIQLTEAARNNVLSAIATIQESLPFLIDLTTEQRQALPKMGDASRGFVSKALELALHDQDFLPRSFDVNQMQGNMRLWEDLGALLFMLNQLHELMDDTHFALGSGLFSNALMIYQYAKKVDHTGTLEQSVVQLGKRFSRKSSKKKGSEEAIAPEM
jgi:hypothetical protein